MKKETLIFLTIGVFFISYGIYREEVVVVLDKGINLCLECVGIG